MHRRQRLELRRGHGGGVRLYPLFDLVGAPLMGAASALLLAAETVLPLRPRAEPRSQRLVINGAMAGLALVVVRLAVIPAMTASARRARKARFGLAFLLPLPRPARAAAIFLALDYSMYLWHRLNHQVPLLWRFHRVHHADLDLDASTAFRFHFGELLASVLFRSAQAALLGVSPGLLLTYEVCMQGATAFHHSSVKLPERLESALNAILVTPRMHGIHHSVDEREVSSNWSVIFACWDRIHATFSPPFPERPLTIGVPDLRDAADLTLGRLLAMPFRRARTAPAEPRSEGT